MARHISTRPTVSSIPVREGSGRLLALNLLISLRPAQWTKNLLVFAALIFSVKLFEPAAVAVSVEAFLIFCALSSVVYLVNDVADRENDQQHPLKRRRPIANGQLPVRTALAMAVMAGLLGVRLEKAGHYDLGDADVALTAAHIEAAWRIVQLACLAAAALVIAWLAARHG